MRRTLALLLALTLARPAAAAPVIRFAAHVESEALAEEAILALHCVSSRAGLPWEFSGEASGSHWLRASEEKGKVRLTWHRPEGEREALLGVGGAEEACGKLEPALALAPAAAAEPALERLGSAAGEEEEAPSRAWLWVGLGAAVAAGFLLWKSRQPDHRGVEMR